jgi:cell division protein FtsZ
MIELGLGGVEFIACNTDLQALATCLAPIRLALGPHTTRGLGAGGLAEVGEAAALESADDLAHQLAGADMVFLTCGMGGGTGTGAIPVAAQVAHEQGSIVVAIVTLPFAFEGRRRLQAAEAGIEKLRQHCDTLITIPNDRLLAVAPRQTTFDVALRLADDVLRQGVQAITELITRPGLVNVDFSHVRSLMQLAGGAYFAVGQGSGPDKAVDAIRCALRNPMVEIGSLDTAAGILVHFTGGEDLELIEVHKAMQEVGAAGAHNAEVVFGAAIDPAMQGRVQAIIVATGVGGQPLGRVIAGASHVLLHSAAPGTSDRSSTAPLGHIVRAGASAPAPATAHRVEPPPPEEDLDIPAFMRRRRRPFDDPTVGPSGGRPAARGGA